jgi:hypothetical protein
MLEGDCEVGARKRKVCALARLTRVARRIGCKLELTFCRVSGEIVPLAE